MVQFKQYLTVSRFSLPLACFGVLLMGFFIFGYIHLRFRDRRHLNMMLLTLIGTVFARTCSDGSSCCAPG